MASRTDVEKLLDSSKYTVISHESGEAVEVDVFVKQTSGSYWERAYARVIADYINITGTNTSKVLAAILKKKDSNNLVVSTVREMAEDTGVSSVTVAKVFKRLQDEDLLKKVRNGKYLLSPDIMRHGSKTKGALLLRLWGDL